VRRLKRTGDVFPERAGALDGLTRAENDAANPTVAHPGVVSLRAAWRSIPFPFRPQ
jgi:hypothetical protein